MTWETMTGREPGWYRDPAPRDPAAPDTLRYWDGANWTGQVRAASKRERREWMAQDTAARHAEAAALVERANAGDVEAQMQIHAATAYVGPGTLDGAVLSGWWRRVAAYLLDFVLVMVLGTLFSWRFLREIWDATRGFVDEVVRAAESGATPPSSAAFEAAVATPMLWVGAIFGVMGVVYEVGFLKAYQATPGKMLVGIEVRLLDRPGPLSWGTVLLRWLGKAGVSLVQLIPFGGFGYRIYILLDYLWPLWDPSNQALHDKLAKTVVVRRG